MAIKNQIRAVTSVAALLAGFGAALPASAGMNMEGLLEKLRDKGVLSDEEFQEMRQEAREARRAEALDKAQAKGDKEAAKLLLQGVDPAKDGFGFKSGDGKFQIRLVGRVQTDYRLKEGAGEYNLGAYGLHDRDTASAASGFELRRARFGFQGFIDKDINYKAEWNIVGGAPIVDEAFANIAYIKPVQFTFGRFKQPFSLQQLTSSNNLEFAERTYVDQNGVPAKKLGAMVSGEPRTGITYAASVFQQGFNELTLSDGSGTMYAGRVTGNIAQLFNVKDTVLHLGVGYVGGSYQLRPTQSDQTSSGYESATRATLIGFQTMGRGLNNIYRAQVAGQDVGFPTLNVTNAAGLTTVTGVTFNSRLGLASESTIDAKQDLLGLEAAVAYKSVKLQGEYTNNQLGAINPVVSGTAASATVDAGAAAANAAICRAGTQPGVNTNNANIGSQTGTGASTTAGLLNDCQQGASGDVNAWYVHAIWNVTGEKWSDNYKGGIFGAVKPINPFRMGSFGWGAIQIGLRYSQFDASGLNVTGSGSRIQSGRSFAGTDQATSFNATNGTLNIKEQTGNALAAVDGDNGKMNSTVSSYGIGLNWLLNNNFKLMFDYTRTDLGGYTVPLDTFTVASSATKVPTVAQNTEVNKVGIKYEDVFLFRGQINF